MSTGIATDWKRIGIGGLIGLIAGLTGLQLFPAGQALLIGLIALLVTLWTNAGLPLGVVSLLPLLLFPAGGIANMATVARNYANPIIFLFIGGFMLAIAVEQTGLHRQIAFRLLRVFPNTTRSMIFALALVSALLSAFLSNTTTALLLMPLATFLSDRPAVKLRLALAIAYGASIGGVITPIGTPPNLILLGFHQQAGLNSPGFVHWLLMMAPLAACMLLLMSWLLSFGVGEKHLSPPASPGPLDAPQRRLLRTLAALLVLLLVNSPIRPWYGGLGLDEKALLLAFGLSTLLPGIGVLRWEDCRKLPYEIVFLFGAGFSIAQAFDLTGLSSSIGGLLLHLTRLDLWLLLLLVATLTTFTTEITSNTALISMLLPIVHGVASKSGLDAGLFMLVATVCASYAFMLPIATPPNAIAVASGAVPPASMLRFGLLLNLAAIALTCLFALTWWPKLL